MEVFTSVNQVPNLLRKAFLSNPELVDPLKTEIFVVPISGHVGGYVLSVCEVVFEYFASTAFLFSQSKLKNKKIMVFHEIYGQVMLAVRLLMGFCRLSLLWCEKVIGCSQASGWSLTMTVGIIRPPGMDPGVRLGEWRCLGRGDRRIFLDSVENTGMNVETSEWGVSSPDSLYPHTDLQHAGSLAGSVLMTSLCKEGQAGGSEQSSF